MLYDNFNYYLKAVFTTSSEIEKIVLDLHQQPSGQLISDDGEDMVVVIEALNEEVKGYFTLLTDTKILIKRVSSAARSTGEDGEPTLTYTSLKLPDFQRPKEIYVAGKVYYLYQATEGPAHSLAKGQSELFKIKYETHETKRELTYEDISHTLTGTEDNPRQLKVNRVYSYANGAYMGDYDEYLALPKLPQIGDMIEINLVAGPGAECPKGDSHFRFLPPADGSTINGNGDDTNHWLEADSIRCIWTDNPSIGWMILSNTHRP